MFKTSQRIYYLNLKASNNIILNSKTAPVIKSNRVQEFKLIEVNQVPKIILNNPLIKMKKKTN